MANFAIAADENVIARGNKLIEELQEPGEKKGVTLNRLFDLVSTHLQEDQLKRSGVDTEALDASITNIRNLFTAALSGKEEIRAEYEPVSYTHLSRKGIFCMTLFFLFFHKYHTLFLFL